MICDELASGLAELFQARRSGLEVAIERTSLPEEGWTYHDLAHNLFATVQRRARTLLEQRDALPPREKHANGAEWVFAQRNLCASEAPSQIGTKRSKRELATTGAEPVVQYRRRRSSPARKRQSDYRHPE